MFSTIKIKHSGRNNNAMDLNENKKAGMYTGQQGGSGIRSDV